MSTENIVSKKFRILTDAVNKVYDRCSFWTKASDVEFTNGNNAQTTLGSITGISDSLTSTSSNVAASAASVKALNDKITELSSNLGSELLWTNPDSDDLDFKAQTVNLDLSKYEAVIICFNARYAVDSYVYAYAKKDNTGIAGNFLFNRAFTRRFTVSNTGITFEDDYDGSSSTANGCVNPRKIYGVKSDILSE